jgi:hypothetical protein
MTERKTKAKTSYRLGVQQRKNLANEPGERKKRAAADEEAIPAKRPKLRKIGCNAGRLAAGIFAFCATT